jgi:hypothetical protein
VFQFARWYSPQRPERAVTRILDRAIGELALLRFVLEQELDLLEYRTDADLRGQLVFPFMDSISSEADRQIGNQDIYTGFSWTSSRESW